MRLGIALSSISNWERNTYPPDPKRLPAIYDFLSYSLVGDLRPLRERLRAWRIAHGLTQRQVAQRLGVATKTVRRLEGTNTRPSVALRRTLQRVLSIVAT